MIAITLLLPLQMRPRLREKSVYIFGTTRAISTVLEFGWPFVHLTSVEFGPGFPPSIQSSSLPHRWDLLLLTANAAVYLLLVSSTVLVTESRLRKPRPMQLSIRSLMAATAVVAILVGFVSNEQSIHRLFGQSFIYRVDLIDWYDVGNPIYWPAVVAMGCTIYSLGWLALAFLRRAYRVVRP